MCPTVGIPDKWVGSSGPVPAEVLLVGEAPGLAEVRTGRPFSGPSGEEIDNVLWRFAKISRSDVRVTNVFPWPLQKPEKKVTEEEWGEARERLAYEIDLVRPKAILACGGVAIHALLPDLRLKHDMETLNALPQYAPGTVIPADTGRVIIVPSFHPAASLRDSSKLQYLINACKALRDVLSGRAMPVVEWAKETASTSITEQIKAISGLLALDTETFLDNSAYIVSVSAREEEAAMSYAWESDKIEAIASAVADPSVTVLLHNALFDLPVLWSLGIVPMRWLDTMSIAFLIQCLPLSLKELAFRLLHMKMRTYEDVVVKPGYTDLSDVPEPERMAYALADPDATLRIYNKMLPFWYSRMDENLQRDMDIQPMVISMMQRGIKATKQHFLDLEEEFMAKNYMRQLDIENFALSYGFTTPERSGKNKGMTFNPRSAPQIADLLYTKMRLATRDRKIKKSPLTGRLSTGKKMLAKIKDTPIVNTIIEYKETATLISNFVHKLPKHIHEDGRIHTDLSMTRILHSGRFASTKPNLLAIPIRNDNGRRIREGFVASEGFTFISNDLSQIELRCMAHISQDAKMLDVYRTDKDIHTNTGMEIFKISDPKDLDDYKHRIPSKTTNFGIANGISPQGLSRELIPIAGPSWTVEVCAKFIDAWFNVYPGVKEHLDRTGVMATRYGYIQDMWGRREYIPQVYSTFDETVAEGIRIAGNQLIQAGAQGIIKEIMRNVWVKYGELWMNCDIAYPILQIHDDLLYECRDKYVKEVGETILYEMSNSVKWMSVPVKAETKTGKVWAKLDKWGKTDGK